jgi:predicted deacylase
VLDLRKFAIGSISIEKGTKGYGILPVTTMSTGFNVEVPVHIISGVETGPTVTLIPMLHGHEFSVIDVIYEVLKRVKPSELKGNIVATTVTNPLAFQMGTRSSWFDGLWGPINDLNRAFPGNPRGWIVERIADVISKYIIPESDVVIDLHGEATHRFGAAYYAYRFDSPGKLGEEADEFTRDLGLEIIVDCSTPRSGSLVGYTRSQGKIAVGIEVCDFWGLEGEPRQEQPKRTITDAGLTCVMNTLKKLDMIEGEIELPRRQVILDGGYVGIAPAHGGLLCPKVTRKDIGRVFSKEQHLGEVISPFTFEILDELRMPFEETLVLAVKDSIPFTHIEPGASDIAFGVADWYKKRWIKRSEEEGDIFD